MFSSEDVTLADANVDASTMTLAELAVAQLYVLPQTLQAADAVTFGADVRNEGGAESGAFTVRFTLDSSETHDVEFPSIAPNASHWQEWQHEPMNAGEHLLSVQLDVQDQVRKGNKYDHSASLPFQVNEAAIADIAGAFANADLAGALDLATTNLLDGDAASEFADAASLFGSTIPAPVVTRVGTSMLITVYFGHDAFVLDTSNLAAVEALAKELYFMVKPEVKVDGYASGEGNAADNVKLSGMRRETVIALLTGANRDAQFDGAAHGASDFAKAETGKGEELEGHRAQNRRVTIFVTGLAEPEKEKPPVLHPPDHIPTEEEIMQDRLNRALKQTGKLPPSGGDKTVIDKLWEQVDETVDSVTRKFTDNKKIRDTIKQGVHKAIEHEAESLFDRAVDQTSLGKSEKDAVKSGIKAVLQLKP